MRIKWTNHPYEKSKNGQTEHVPRSVYESAITFKQGEPAPPARYGSTEWLEEKQAVGRQMNPPRPDPVVTWGVKTGYNSMRPAIVASCSNPNCNINFRFEGPAFKTETDGRFKRNVPVDLSSIVFTHSCGHAFPETVPAHIVEQYRKAYAEGVFALPADEAAMLAQAAAGRTSKISDKTKAWQDSGFVATPMKLPSPWNE